MPKYESDTFFVDTVYTSFKVADSDCSAIGVSAVGLSYYYNLTANSANALTTEKGPGVLSECVTIDSCPSLLNNPTAPATTVIPCGFDEQQSVVKICCPEDQVTEPRVLVGSMIIRYKSETPNHEYLIKLRF